MLTGKKLQVIWLHYWHNSHAMLWITEGVWPYPLQKDAKEEKLSNMGSNPASFLKQVFTSLLI